MQDLPETIQHPQIEEPTRRELLVAATSITEEDLHFENHDRNVQLYKEYEWSGTIGEAVTQLRESMGNDNRFIHAPLLLRGIVNYRTTHPEDAHDIMRQVVDLCVAVADNQTIKDESLDTLELAIREHPGLSEMEFEQQADVGSTDAARPRVIKRAAMRLGLAARGQNVRFIPFAGGGLIGGLELFTIAKEKGLIGKDSVFYPIRFSMGKKQDATPHIGNDDLEALTETDFQVITYDDDITSGSTSAKGSWHLKNQLGVDSITPITSLTLGVRYEPEPSIGFAYNDPDFIAIEKELNEKLPTMSDPEEILEVVDPALEYIDTTDTSYIPYVRRVLRHLMVNEEMDIEHALELAMTYCQLIPETDFTNQAQSLLQEDIQIQREVLKARGYNLELDYVSEKANSDEPPTPPYSLSVERKLAALEE